MEGRGGGRQAELQLKGIHYITTEDTCIIISQEIHMS